MNTYTTIGLIECGFPEKSFLERSAALPQNFRLNKAFVFHENTKTALRKRFPQIEWAADYNALLQDENIGLIVISAPSDKHRSLIGAALKAKKHVQIV